MQKTIITPEPDRFIDFFKKIWQYRVLIYTFAMRDLKVKYAQTFLGISWSLLQPLTALIIFTLFFGYILQWTADEIPYALHVLSGLLGWNFFAYIVHAGSMSVQESAHIVKKIYFPKSVMPLSKVIVALVELGLSFLILIPLMLYYEQSLSWKVVFIPFVLLFNALCGLLLVFWISALAYRLRDLYHLLPFIVYFGIWLTPVFFTNSFFPDSIRFIVELNPMANVVNMWRWMLFDNIAFQINWLINFFVITLLCLTGMFYYNRKEHQFSDFA